MQKLASSEIWSITTPQLTKLRDGLMNTAAETKDIGAYNPEARSEERDQPASDVERFLKSGGKVAEIPKGERADPPKKPENNYGRGSI